MTPLAGWCLPAGGRPPGTASWAAPWRCLRRATPLTASWHGELHECGSKQLVSAPMSVWMLLPLTGQVL
jgi:hypothetical protein